MLIKIKQDNMDHGAKQARYGTGGLFGRNTNKLVRAKTGKSIGEKISSAIGGVFNKEKPTSTTPIKKEMVHSQILNEYDSPASRLQEEFGGLNQDTLNPVQNAAITAGGSRPMTAMNNPQIDPITGMPITAGGQANMNPNFIGGMANSNIPTTAMLAQEKKMMRTMKPLPPAVPDKSDSTAMFMGGNAPGQYANPIWTPAADSAKVRFPNIEANKIKSSDIFKKGDQLHDITRHIPIVNKRYGTEEASKKAFDEAMIDQQRYKIGQENKERKSMRVKKK